MNRTLNIVAVRTIFNIDRPIVVFEVANHEAIIRTPQQALVDLQNSGRALKLDYNVFKNGLEGVSLDQQAKLKEALLDTIGATLTGNITAHKAGDTYVIEAGHPALTDATHPLYGQVKEGSTAKNEKDGLRIEGFLSIPLTFQEKALRNAMEDMPAFMSAMFGFSVPTTPIAVAVVAENTEAPTLEPVGAEEAFGKATK